MTITHGVEESFYQNFILTEDRLKDFTKILENAVQRFPAQAEVTYTVLTSDLRYFETARVEDVLHDPAVQDYSILQLTMQADFVEELPRIEGETIHKGTRENWYIRLMFSLRRRSAWDAMLDRINLKVVSEDRKWANDYIDRFEEQIYKLPGGNRTPTLLLWVFAVPLFLLVSAFLNRNAGNPEWFSASPLTWVFFYIITLFSALMVLGGISLTVFKFNPQVTRAFFGPMSAFHWGSGQQEYEMFEKFRHVVSLVLGAVFVGVLFASVKFAGG